MIYALLTGIDKYQLPGSDLNGCVNDAYLLKDTLLNICHVDDVEIFVNEEVTSSTLPQILRRNFAKLKKDDEFIWCHSGHGTFVPDYSGDEADKYDEALVLYDSIWGNMFTDDQMYSIFFDFPKFAYYTLLLDSCFSGGLNRDINKTSELPPRFLPPPEHVVKRIKTTAKKRKIGERVFPTGVLITASAEKEYSNEMYFGGKTYGVFSRAVAKELEYREGKLTNYDLWKNTTMRVLNNMVIQHPQIFGSAEMQAHYFLANSVPVSIPPKQSLLKKIVNWIKNLFS